MITAAQLRAARVLLGLDQRRLAELSGLSVPTIQRMEASETMVRGNVDSLVKLIAAFDAAGIEMIDEGAVSKCHASRDCWGSPCSRSFSVAQRPPRQSSTAPPPQFPLSHCSDRSAFWSA